MLLNEKKKKNWMKILCVEHLALFLACSKYQKMGLPCWLRKWRICLQCRRPGFNPWVRKIPWRREQLPTPIFLAGEFHGQRSLVGYCLWGCKHCSWHATSINKYELLMIVLLFWLWDWWGKIHPNHKCFQGPEPGCLGDSRRRSPWAWLCTLWKDLCVLGHF